MELHLNIANFIFHPPDKYKYLKFLHIFPNRLVNKYSKKVFKNETIIKSTSTTAHFLSI